MASVYGTTIRAISGFRKLLGPKASAVKVNSQLQLWDCCPKDLQTILRRNRMGNISTKTVLLTKMKSF